MRLPRKSERPDSLCPIATLAAAIAAIAMTVADLMDNDHGYRVGLVLLILAATGIIWRRSGVSADALDRVRQSAYDDGYADGSADTMTPPALLAVAPGRSVQQLGQ